MTKTTKRQTAGELANKALSDNTKYDAMEIAQAVVADIEKQLYLAIQNYHDKIEENEFCVVMVLGEDPLIANLKRRKYYCWPWLPSPRPNQTVFLYNKELDRITKRLWVLPNAQTMAELCTPGLTPDPQYYTMRLWSMAFFNGVFWDVIRQQHDIKMLSQEEFFELHRDELAKAKLDDPDLFAPKPFDFSKITANNV